MSGGDYHDGPTATPSRWRLRGNASCPVPLVLRPFSQKCLLEKCLEHNHTLLAPSICNPRKTPADPSVPLGQRPLLGRHRRLEPLPLAHQMARADRSSPSGISWSGCPDKGQEADKGGRGGEGQGGEQVDHVGQEVVVLAWFGLVVRSSELQNPQPDVYEAPCERAEIRHIGGSSLSRSTSCYTNDAQACKTETVCSNIRNTNWQQ